MANIRALCSAIAKLEGLKSQVSIGNVREIVGLVSDEIFADGNVTEVWEGPRRYLRVDSPLALALWKNGQRRSMKNRRH